MQRKPNPLLLKRMAAQDRAMAYTLTMSPKAQELKRVRRESAADACGVLSHGLERYIFSCGQFGVIEFLHELLGQTGPVHSIVSLWPAHGGEIEEAHSFLESGRLLSCRWLVDSDFQRRKPGFVAQLGTLFGLEAIRVTRTHAKFVCLWNDSWNVCLFTSANLNSNPRNENFLVRESPELVQFHRDFIAELWANKAPEESLEPKAKVNKARFEEE